MNPLFQLKKATALSFVALAWLALSPMVQARLAPPPDGGYAGGNTAEGNGALDSVRISVGLQTGLENTAIGFDALNANTTGSDNTASGDAALLSNTTGEFNTATGVAALQSNTTGNANTATGGQVLFSNTTGHDNTAIGFDALNANTEGNFNTASGVAALLSNTGDKNTASGNAALQNNTAGSGNTADGQAALFNNTGDNNIALGKDAGRNLTTGKNNIDIFDQGVAGEANTIRIGTQGTQTAIFVAGIVGGTGTPVLVNADGKLSTTSSSARFKDEIKPMGTASETILALQPVTFRYKHEIDPNGIPQFGLVAEEVERVNPDLVVRDAAGEVYSVRYEAVNAMLLNEFLKEHKTVQEQGAMIARQQKQIEALTAGLQKVSAQLELIKAAPRAVDNSQ